MLTDYQIAAQSLRTQQKTASVNSAFYWIYDKVRGGLYLSLRLWIRRWSYVQMWWS
jgi:hypothetical protein